MIRAILSILFLAALLLIPARAVQMNGSFDTTAPTNSDIANWTTGWGAPGVTGWNYVGQIGGGASGVYVGNGWVMTAAHVGAGTFVVDGGTYLAVPGSTRSISDSNGTADLVLFQIATSPTLPPLTLSLNPPTAFSQTQPGSSVVMLGFGSGGLGETWGVDHVSLTNILINPQSTSYFSNDFITVNGTFNDGAANSINNSTLVGGDSGGADFLFNATTQTWELTGINEVTGSGTLSPQDNPGDVQSVTLSGMVQVNTYQSQIQSIMASDAPEPATWVLFSVGLVCLWLCFLRRRSV